MFKRQSAAIEKVQRRATKLLKETKKLSYDARLKMLDLPTLKYRRFRGDMIQVYKINNVDNINFDTFFVNQNQRKLEIRNKFFHHSL